MTAFDTDIQQAITGRDRPSVRILWRAIIEKLEDFKAGTKDILSRREQVPSVQNEKPSMATEWNKRDEWDDEPEELLAAAVAVGWHDMVKVVSMPQFDDLLLSNAIKSGNFRRVTDQLKREDVRPQRKHLVRAIKTRSFEIFREVAEKMITQGESRDGMEQIHRKLINLLPSDEQRYSRLTECLDGLLAGGPAKSGAHVRKEMSSSRREPQR